MTNSILDTKFKGRVPIILHKGKGDITELEKGRFLINKNTTLGQFMYVMRRKNQILPTQAIYVFCSNVLPTSNATMLDLWTEHHDEEDNILYLTYSTENTFG